jgi:DNA repair exonuclease SbcCD ATPase subunit
MTDLVERLREEVDRLSCNSLSHGCAACGVATNLADEAATALEAKDKELAALRERVKGLRAKPPSLDAQSIPRVDALIKALEARAETAEQRVKVLEARQADDLAEFGLMEVRAETALRRVAELEARAAALFWSIPEDVAAKITCGELQKRAKELLTAEQRLKSRDTCQDAAFAKLLDRKDELAKLLATAERERDRIADELDTMNHNHRLMAKLLADTGRERDEAREAINTIDKILHTPTGNENAMRHFQRDFDAVRRLAKPFRAARAITGEKP